METKKFKDLEKEFKCGKELARKKWNEQEGRITTYITKNGKKIMKHLNSTMVVENNVFPYKLTSEDKKAADWYVLNPDVGCGEGCGCIMTQEEAEQAQNELENKKEK